MSCYDKKSIQSLVLIHFVVFKSIHFLGNFVKLWKKILVKKGHNSKNIFFRIPFDTELYFKLLYGDDWKTPKKYTNWFKNANDLELDINFLNVLKKIIWKISNTIDRVINYNSWEVYQT